MQSSSKYSLGYYLPPVPCFDWTQKDRIEKAPLWCSVDLRDGNQALVVPMNIVQKSEFFKELVALGFKCIEIGFPAASETEFTFCRTLIERNLIPDDVTIQVLTQAREHIIKRTFEAVQGCSSPVIIHIYNSTSRAQREQVFHLDRDEIKELAVAGATLLKRLVDDDELQNIRFEYSPESFTGTEPEFALEVCNAVLKTWNPSRDCKAVINLPATVEMSIPHVYAQQVEYIHKNIEYRDCIELSLHPHNDRGTGIACAELGILAGADRVEGTLFGNGERTGNVDIVTLAMNLFSQGVDPELDFSNMPYIVDLYERLTGMRVEPRHPYSGDLVFAAFSGSHQDAIAKGMKWRQDHGIDTWSVPYLPIDPRDVGRHYETEVIRINSQSGKGGIGYVLEKNYGYSLPKALSEELSYKAKDIADKDRRELSAEEVLSIFLDEYVNKKTHIDLKDFHFKHTKDNSTFTAQVMVAIDGLDNAVMGVGNGRLSAVSNALSKVGVQSHLETYSEHALGEGSRSQAAAYVSISGSDGNPVWGVGVHHDIITASLLGLISAINRKLESSSCRINAT